MLTKAARSSQKKNENRYPFLTIEERTNSTKKARNQNSIIVSTYTSAGFGMKANRMSFKYRVVRVNIMNKILEYLLSIELLMNLNHFSLRVSDTITSCFDVKLSFGVWVLTKFVF
jgi:hypothetical protein